MGMLDMNLKPDTDNKNLLTKIVNYPVTRTLKREEQALMWKYRYYLTQNKKALTKFLQCFDLNLEFEGNMLMELMLKWQPMDVEDALELLGSKYKNYPKIRSYAISRLRLASNEDLILYLLQLVQALRYENFNLPNQEKDKQQKNLPTIQSLTTINDSLTSSNLSTAKTSSSSPNMSSMVLSSNKDPAKLTTHIENNNDQQQNINNNESSDLSSSLNKSSNLENSALQKSSSNTNQNEYSKSPPLASNYDNPSTNLLHSESITKKTFDSNLRSFLLQRATENEIVALCLYWFVKVEMKDTKSLPTSSTNTSLSGANNNNASSNNLASLSQEQSSNNTSNNNNNNSNNNQSTIDSKSNFQIFMDELLDKLRNGDNYARSTYENITNQERFLKSLNDIVKATNRESGGRDKKVTKLRQFLIDTSKSFSSFDLMNFHINIPLIIDPGVKTSGINVDKTTMFNSNLMPCKFVFKTVPNNSSLSIDSSLNNKISSIQSTEYATIYKVGDDLRQDQLVLQMIALMDKLLKQENLDLKLTPYKVIATGVKEGFVQFVDAIPISAILANNSEYRTIKEYLRRNNPSETDKYGIAAEAMDNYVRSCAGYMVITYILGVGDRHYDNILITKTGKLLHIDFGYILGREPKPFQPIIKWTKDMADGMGGKYGSDGKENKEYEDFKRYCYNAFLHLRRHANLILNLFSLMVDSNIPDIALEADKTVKKLIDRFKLDINDDQASAALIKEIESNYDSIVGNITDILHTYSTARAN